MQLFVSNVYILYRHITYKMASQINAPTTFLPSVSPSALGGNAPTYQEKINGGKRAQQRGGQGYGYEGKMIAPGVAEVSSYKGGRKRQSKKRRNSRRRQNKSRRQR
jgi:hypothetical protein